MAIKKGICRLTLKECELQMSHIYPKFAIEWTKATGSKYMRSYANPNKRIQDGYKVALLSWEAEQMFSKSEDWFAKNVFRKYLSDYFSEINYDDNLFYFAISFLWRILVLELNEPNIKEFKFYNRMKEAEEAWRLFLLNRTYPRGYDSIHLILSSEVTHHHLASNNVNFFFTRSLDGTTVYNEKECSIFGKFSKFIFWAFITDQDDSDMKGTKINPICGSMRAPQNFDRFDISSFFQNRIDQYDKRDYPSEKQQDVILQEILKDPEKHFNSEMMQSMIRDQEMYEINKLNNKE